MHSLIFLEPGHFHAALTLRAANPRVDEEIHLYARPGAERDAFLALVASFNARDEQPTAWRVRVHERDEPLAALVAERRAGLVILAGRNDGKLATIARLHAAGCDVLADKPWLVCGDALPHLEAVTAGPPLAMDIMTNRFDVTARLLRRIRACEALFGDGFALSMPAVLDSGHESHFPMVLDECLDHLDSGRWPHALARRIRLRYTLLARARELALREA